MLNTRFHQLAVTLPLHIDVRWLTARRKTRLSERQNDTDSVTQVCSFGCICYVTIGTVDLISTELVLLL